MPSAHYVHPEFGYFCPGLGLRRVLRVAVVSILFGIIIGASVIRLRAGHDCQAVNAWTIAHTEPSRAATVFCRESRWSGVCQRVVAPSPPPATPQPRRRAA